MGSWLPREPAFTFVFTFIVLLPQPVGSRPPPASVSLPAFTFVFTFICPLSISHQDQVQRARQPSHSSLLSFAFSPIHSDQFQHARQLCDSFLLSFASLPHPSGSASARPPAFIYVFTFMFHLLLSTRIYTWTGTGPDMGF